MKKLFFFVILPVILLLGALGTIYIIRDANLQTEVMASPADTTVTVPTVRALAITISTK